MNSISRVNFQVSLTSDKNRMLMLIKGGNYDKRRTRMRRRRKEKVNKNKKEKGKVEKYGGVTPVSGNSLTGHFIGEK